jgi:predicted nucleic-acid-binding protein
MKAEVFVTSGVWMETEWVLRSVYGWPRGRVSDAFRKLLGTGTISVTEEAGLFWAIDRYAAGADWADMVHLVDSSRHDAFLTFEHRLDEEAGAASPTRVERLR